MGELFLWMLGAVAVLAAIGLILWQLRIGHELFGNFGQGAAGLLSVIALFLAAGIYFFERENKPKVVLQPPTGTVIPLSPGESGEVEAVILHLALPIENKSSRSLKVKCAALDLIHVDVSGARNVKYFEDLPGVSLLKPPPNRESFDRCVTEFEEPRRIEEERFLAEEARGGAVNPMRSSERAVTGMRFTDFTMEPGETVTKTWDHRVSCAVEAVQVIFKLPKPGTVVDYEAKSLVPIASHCRSAAAKDGPIGAPGAAPGDGGRASGGRGRSGRSRLPPG